ncbi:hypothetical protein DL769_001042 [Monosporascus sp. CRB-8-3]|nr:hypothetical protein DL769_001042 [Monosporascus sp. CRB-8-3]
MTLSDVPDDWIYNGPMGDTIRYMRETGFHEWGFVIYRCVYGDDDIWNRYIAALKEDVHEDLDYNGRDLLLEQYAQWAVVEDKDALDGAPKSRVRQRFVEWRNQHSVSRGVSPVPLPTDASNRLPRFTYCLYVDQKCLDTLRAHVNAKAARRAPGLGPRPPPLVAVVIDGDFCQPDSDADVGSQRYPPIDGCTDNYVGWQYYNVRYLATLYDSLHRGHLNGYFEYKRPPAIGPSGRQSMEN